MTHTNAREGIKVSKLFSQPHIMDLMALTFQIKAEYLLSSHKLHNISNEWTIKKSYFGKQSSNKQC